MPCVFPWIVLNQLSFTVPGFPQRFSHSFFSLVGCGHFVHNQLIQWRADFLKYVGSFCDAVTSFLFFVVVIILITTTFSVRVLVSTAIRSLVFAVKSSGHFVHLILQPGFFDLRRAMLSQIHTESLFDIASAQVSAAYP